MSNWHDTDRAPQDNTSRGCAFIAFGTICFWGVVVAIALLYIGGWWRINQLNFLESRKGPTAYQP